MGVGDMIGLWGYPCLLWTVTTGKGGKRSIDGY